MDKKWHYTLWTGGWDSTFRMVELSREDVIVQPVYVIDEGRKSTDKEKCVMAEILEALRKREGTQAELRDVIFVNKQEIPADEKITAAYQSVKARQGLGGQYDWLARLAKQYPGIEIGVGKPTNLGGCRTLIHQQGKLVEKDGRLQLDPEASTEECMLLLGNFTFPIGGRTEEDMVNAIHTWGYEDIMSMIWFCHSPIHGKACGMCNPCRIKIEGGMEWLLPEDSRKRYRIHTKVRKLFGKKVGEVYRRVRCKL